MAMQRANTNGTPRGSNYSSTGKPTRILKIRAKKAPTTTNLMHSGSDPTNNKISILPSPPQIEISHRFELTPPTPDLGPSPSLVHLISDNDFSNSSKPDSPISAGIFKYREDTPSSTSLASESDLAELGLQHNAAIQDLPNSLSTLTRDLQELVTTGFDSSMDRLALDSGVEMSPLKYSPPRHSTFNGPKENTNPIPPRDVVNESIILDTMANLSSYQVEVPASPDESIPSSSYEATLSSLSIPSIVADRSSTPSSIQSSEDLEPPHIPLHRRDISIESDLLEALSMASTFRDSPQPSLRSQTITPDSERVQMATPCEDYEPIPDNVPSLLYVEQGDQFSGYSIDLFLDHHTVLKAMYSCPRCKCIIREPHFSEWEACCKICLPKLRSPQKVKQAIFDKHLNKKIQALAVKCPLTGRGCQWRGKLKQIEAHLTKSCPYMRFRCPHKGCDQVFYKLQLENHINGECGQRKSNCPHCNTEISVQRFNDHLIYVRCPKECSESSIPQCQLGLHILKQCEKIMVPCPYSSYGCEDQVPRGNIHEHMITENGNHLRLLRTLVDDSRSTIEKLVEENESLQGKIQSGRRECVFLERNINLPGTLLWKIPKISHQMKNKHVVESKSLVIEGYPIYALLWFGGWHSPGDVELGIIRSEEDSERNWPVFFKVHYTMIHPTDSTQAISAESTAKFDLAQRGEKKEKTWNKTQGFVSEFIPVLKRQQLHSYLMDGSLYIKVEIDIVNTLPAL